MKRSGGKRVALWAGAAAVAVVVVAAWLGWDHIRFWWFFVALGRNEQGMLEYRHRPTGMVFVRVPGGTFWMGAQRMDPEQPNYDAGAMEDEGPVQEVAVRAFLIGKYEVTRSQWTAVFGTSPWEFRGYDNPVGGVSWDDCQYFLKKLNAMGCADRCRLPTEAEWEYACRAGTRSRFFHGDDPEYKGLRKYAWYIENSGGATHPVGQTSPNPWGLHDMHGNFEEWCQSLFWLYPYNLQDGREDLTTIDLRILRGGSCVSTPTSCRSAYRDFHSSSDQGYAAGFRVAMDL